MRKILLLTLAAALVAGPAFGQKRHSKKQSKATEPIDSLTLQPSWEALSGTFDMIDKHYVEQPNLDKVSEAAIVNMLKTLDPHSMYIPARDVEKTNEPLNASFEGVGISFQIVHDTVQVMEVIAGGPSEKVGLMIGDKIVATDGVPFTGDSITNAVVPKRLRGKKGTTIVLEVLRAGEVRQFHVTRDRVPINSVTAHFMIDSVTGYIYLARFARTSAQEVRQAILDLQRQGMRQLVFDLRGNGGGFLDVACAVADEFLPQGHLIVYQIGRDQPRQNFVSTRRGSYLRGPLVVLIDEGSASASEIVSGAVQDWDRGTIVGRRSFGKGLVQRMYTLKEGSQVRLTTARYYTPSGRCIQKPYDKGVEAYLKDIERRYQRGEMVHPDSIQMPDSLMFKTASGRVVYGGGGIMPDVFVPMDTTRLSDYYLNLRAKGVINDFCASFADQHRADSALATYEGYLSVYDSLGVDSLFASYASKKDVKRDEVKGEWVAQWVTEQLRKQLKDSTWSIHAENYLSYLDALLQDSTFLSALQEKAQREDQRTLLINQRSDAYLHTMLKALIARNLYGHEHYTRVIMSEDDCLQRAMRELKVES